MVKYSYKFMVVKVCMAKYNQRQCKRILSDRLMEKRYMIFRSSNYVPKYIIQAIKDNKKLNYLVRHFEYDNAYKNSPLTYQIYKIKAFNNEEEKQKGKHLHFIVDRPCRAAGTLPPPLEVREFSSGWPCR